jgi:hypothetical protein
MKIISNRRGDYLQVLKEFETESTHHRGDRWFVALYHGEVVIYYEKSSQIWNKEGFMEFKSDSELAIWRNPELKELRVKLYNELLNSLIQFERDFKIEEVFRNEDEHTVWLC